MKKTIKVDDMVDYLAQMWWLKEEKDKEGDFKMSDAYLQIYLEIVTAMQYCLVDSEHSNEQISNEISKKVQSYYYEHYYGRTV